MPDLEEYMRRRSLHTRLVAACEGVMWAGDLTDQAVADGLGRPTATLFDVYGRTARLVVDAGKLVGLAHARWEGFPEPATLVAAVAEVIDAIDELLES